MAEEKVPKWLKDMIKVDIHCHMGGSIRIPTILELADNYGIKLPATDEGSLKKLIIFKDRRNKSLEGYLQGITICESVLVKPEAFERVAYEICEDAHKENVKVFELRFGPTNYANGSLHLHEIMESTLSGLKRASDQFDMYTGLIVCGIRTDPKSTAMAAEVAANYHPFGVVGFDLAGKEQGHRPKDFRDIIKPVKESMIPVTIHAGEDDTVESIAEAIQYLNAERIGHGISLRQSSQILEFMNQTRKTIESCCASNIDTGSVASYETHPIRVYYNQDLRVCVNTDNRTISDTTITKEYMQLMKYQGFTQDEIFHLGRHAIKGAFLQSHPTKELLKELDAYGKSFR